MSKGCGICGMKPTTGGLIKQYKEKHPLYLRLYLRLTVVKAIIASAPSSLLLFLLSRDASVESVGFLIGVFAPIMVLAIGVVWVTIALYLRKVRRSLKPSNR